MYDSGPPLLEIPHTGWFSFEKARIGVSCEPDARPVPYLLGRVFALWLELQGVPVLHGSCLGIHGGAVGFLGYSGTGKTTISTALLQRDCSLLTDDLIPITSGTPLVHPGIPVSKMWPDTATHFYGDHQFSRIHPQYEKLRVTDPTGSRFREEALPLKVLIVLERYRPEAGQAITMTELTGALSLMELVRLSFGVEEAHALGLQSERLPRLAAATEQIKVYRLRYPSDLNRLPQLCDHVLETLDHKA